jgi:hypothetical protein
MLMPNCFQWQQQVQCVRGCLKVVVSSFLLSVATTSWVIAAMSRVQGFVLRFFGWARGYVRENWGAPFVFAFMGLLVVAAALLILGLPWSAEAVGNVAYFSLVFGVVLQLLCFRRRGDKDVGGDD